MALVRLGPASVRGLAEIAGLNRGTTHEALKWLQERGLVSFYEKQAKQFFVAEDPERLRLVAESKTREQQAVERALDQIVPELRSLYHRGGDRPVARYFEKSQLHFVLEDVLMTCETKGELLYRIYSAASIREYLYDQFPTFSDVRIAKGIQVKVLALGDGGQLRGLDERKWLRATLGTPTYMLLYPGKTAAISLDAKGDPMAVLVENEGVYELQKSIFENLWQHL